jgi:sulfotransferase
MALMNKTYYFMAGLPRSGSTLLKSIIDQNPNIHANPVSPVMELMYWNDHYFTDSEQYLGYPKPKSAHKVISSIIDNYYFDTEEPIVIDHCRAWSNNIERIKTYITPNPKIICPVRNVLEVLTSFITMVHRNSEQVSFIDQHLIEKGLEITDDNRCDYLMSKEGIVEQALWAQSQAFIRGDDKKHLLMVEYDDLVNCSDETMRRIYEFLELDYYKHDFKNVENKHREIDDQWYLKDMHYVRKEVKKKSKKPEDVLSTYILNKYSNLEYWKYSNHRYY